MMWFHLKSVIVVVLQLSIIDVLTYNIDTKYPIVLSNGLPNSYFGYSVSLLNNTKGSWLIAGAPKANSSKNPAIPEPGEIFKCPLGVNNENHQCQILQLDNTIDKDSSKYELGNFGWLGVNVDTTQAGDGLVVACGHRWINTILQDRRLLNGVCYTIDSELHQSSISRHRPLAKATEQYLSTGQYNYAFAQMGTSAQFVKGSSSLLLGAPGIIDWKGSVVRVVQTKPGSQTAYPYTVARSLQQIGHTSYFGYAVSSGIFQRNQGAQFVVGAPRAGYRGKVYIGDINWKEFIVKVEKTGEQMGEYFGSSVCAVDFNGDQLDDLLVGAPLFSKGSAGDEGRVYVFQNKGSLLLELGNNFRMGSSVTKARFGSTITNIGDVNWDGYNDVAIGAPYENDRGAIYIYHGGPDGLSHEFKQRITAEDFKVDVRGFGVSISRGMDVDHNNYLDIVVGAYDSDQAILLRSHPLIKLTGKITHSVKVLDYDKKNCELDGTMISCFKVTICLHYNGKFPPTSINVTSKFEVNTQRGSNPDFTRVFLRNESKQRVAVINRTLLLNVDVDKCIHFPVYVSDALKDFFNPIHMKLSYGLFPMPPHDFCPECPMLDSTNDLSVNSEVRFLTNCTQGACQSDLQLTASFKDLGGELVYGSRDTVLLEVVVHNAAGRDTAFTTRLSLTIPKWIDISKKPVACEFIPQDGRSYRLLNCSVATRLHASNTTMLEFILNVQRVEEKQIEINVTVDSDSKELNWTDNRVNLNLPITFESDIYVTGLTVNDQVFYSYDDKGKVAEGEETTFLHSYEISNKGPSPMESLFIEVTYPSPLTGEGSKIIEILPEKKQNGQGGGVFGLCEGETASGESSGRSSSLEPLEPQEAGGESISRRRRDVSSQSVINNTDAATEGGKKSKEYLNLNCSSSTQCAKFKCTIGSVGKDVRATLIVKFIVNVFELKKLMGDLDTAVVKTEGKVYSNNSFGNKQPDGHKSDLATVSTEIKPDGPPLPEKLASWIIPVSVVGGLLLLIFIIVGLVKLGFFRRKAREDMEKLKERSGAEPQSSGQPEQNEALMDS